MISISSDLGENNYALASLIAKIVVISAEDKVVSLFHQNIVDVENTAYQILGAIRHFPQESIHIIYAQQNTRTPHILAVHLLGHWVVTMDTGLISLLLPLDYNASVYLQQGSLEESNFESRCDEILNMLKSVKNGNIKELQVTSSYAQSKPINTGLVFSPNNILSRVIHVDARGHIVVNLLQKEFDEATAGKSFYIQVQSLKIRRLSNSFTDVNNNQIGALFNSLGFLEIFMVGENLSKLLSINKLINNKIEIILENDTNRQDLF